MTPVARLAELLMDMAAVWTPVALDRPAQTDRASDMTSAAPYLDVLALDQLPDGQGRTVRAAGRAVALFNVGGVVHAIEDGCLHAGGSLGRGRLQGCWVACPAHGWRFDVTTGALAGGGDAGVARYPAKVEGGRILVAVGAPQKLWAAQQK